MLSAQAKYTSIIVAAISVLAFAVVLIPGSDAEGTETSTTTTYQFYLVNSVDGEDSTINGWYTGTGSTVVSAFCNALDTANITYKGFTADDSSITFGDQSISNWSKGAWASDGNYFGANYAIWNYNSTDGWHLGNTFGTACGSYQPGHKTADAVDTAFIISHEKYYDADGAAAAAVGVDAFTAWGDPADYDLVYDGTTGGYADASVALKTWYKNTYGYGDLSEYGISLKSGSTEYDSAEDAATMWKASFDGTAYYVPAGMNADGAQYGYIQRAPQDLTATPATVVFGPVAVTEYTFILNNSVTGEDSEINGTYTGIGANPVQALIYALDKAGIAHSLDWSEESVWFADRSISDWSSAWDSSATDCYGANYAVWNYNSTDGWFIGNSFGTDSETVYMISHENYYVASGKTAASLGVSQAVDGSYACTNGLSVAYGMYVQTAPRDATATPDKVVFGPAAVSEYTFILNNSVTGEDSEINGTYAGIGTNAVEALVYALNNAKITHAIDYTAKSMYFGDKSISNWTSAWDSSATDCYGANYAVWNYNSTDGWFLGNTFGKDTETVYMISHENYYVASGPSAKSIGVTFDGESYTAPDGVIVQWGMYVQTAPMDYMATPDKLVFKPYFFITFECDNGTDGIKVAGTEGSVVKVPADPTKTGYMFLKWLDVPATMPAYDSVVKALWGSIPEETSTEVIVDLVDNSNFKMPETTKPVVVSLKGDASVKISDTTSLTGKIVTSSIESIENKTGVEGKAYEFTFTADDTEYNGKLRVTIPYSVDAGKSPVVYYVNDAGEKTEMRIISYTDDLLTFETDHNSVYVLASEDKEDNSTLTQIATVILVIVAVLAAALAIFKSAKKQ